MGLLEFVSDVAIGVATAMSSQTRDQAGAGGSNGYWESKSKETPPWDGWSGTKARNRADYVAATGMEPFHVDGEGWFGRKPGSTQTHRLPWIPEPTPEQKLHASAASQGWSGSDFHPSRSPSAGSRYPSSLQNFYALNVFGVDAECGSCGTKTTTGVPSKVTEYRNERRDFEMRPMCSECASSKGYTRLNVHMQPSNSQAYQ